MDGDAVREIERLLGIVVIAKCFRPRMLMNIKNVKKRYIENIFTNWKLFQNVLKNRELIYLRFGCIEELEGRSSLYIF
jgi:hypothetical protein